jgi:DNA-directed RNA polymerase subunit L
MKSKPLINSLNKQLGIYVGGYVITHYLQTLSTDYLKSNIVIKVSDEDTNTWAELEKIHESTIDEVESTKVFYENLAWYKAMEKKYLPEKIECMVPRIEPTDMEEFKEGVKEAIWDCDMSSYDLDEPFFVQTHEYAWCSIINLKIL